MQLENLYIARGNKKEINEPEIIVISSVSPAPTSAGELVLYRHLIQAQSWKISVVPNPKKLNRKAIAKIVARLSRTRLHSWINDFNVITCGQNWENLLKSHQPTTKNTIVLTIAHGDGCWAALRYAKRHNLPLVSIFHDWWPIIPSVHTLSRQLLEHRFHQLYRESDLAFCVSEEMRKALGQHKNSHVLYPIPAESLPESVLKKSIRANNLESIRVLYSGSLYDYGSMVAELLQITKDCSTVQVQVRGKNPNWTAEFHQEMSERNLWLDFAPRSQLNEWLASADALLVAMSFDHIMERRMATSFPSKLCEYVQFGKPIVIWGPEYCSAVQWAKKSDWALCVTDRNPRYLVSALEKLQNSPSLRQHYAAMSGEVARNYFNPLLIQQQFLNAIDRLTSIHCKNL